MDKSLAWIEVASGRKFYVLEPRAEDICIDDIAHALPNICRFTGHTREFYSVAEHSFWASILVPEEDAKWALLHDASEAYLTDLNAPTKKHTELGIVYKEIENRVMAAVCEKFGLPTEEPPSVKAVDRQLMWAEKDQLFSSMSWEEKWGTPDPARIKLRCWMPNMARDYFRWRFDTLFNEFL